MSPAKKNPEEEFWQALNQLLAVPFNNKKDSWSTGNKNPKNVKSYWTTLKNITLPTSGPIVVKVGKDGMLTSVKLEEVKKEEIQNIDELQTQQEVEKQVTEANKKLSQDRASLSSMESDLRKVLLRQKTLDRKLEEQRANLAKAKTELQKRENDLNKVKGDQETVDEKLKTHEFSSFLSSIGESVVAAQENLDNESIKYLTELKSNKIQASIIPPTVFRIPKLKASLKLGIERSEGKKLNVLIFGKEEESKTINQQSVEMEIMAVPASAELLQNLEGKIPQIQFVLSPREREALFENIEGAISNLPAGSKKESLSHGNMLQTKNKNRVIFWRTEDPDIFLVLYTTKTQLLMWQLNSNKPSTIESIIEYNNYKGYKLIEDFVSKLAASQETLLNS